MPVIAGNWKMYKTRAEALALLDGILAGSGRIAAGTDLLVFPPFTALSAVAERCRGTRLRVGGQNLHPSPAGAFTGEVSAPLLRDAGASHVLVGHSERRQHFHEDDLFLSRKVTSALEGGLVPVFCLGETLEERDGGRTEAVVGRQLEGGLGGLAADDLARILIAYEPVWAIGTGRTATPEQARETHAHLRSLLVARWGEPGRSVPLLYGGSVKPDNAGELLSQPEIDGVLVGGASLEPESFVAIASAAVGA